MDEDMIGHCVHHTKREPAERVAPLIALVGVDIVSSEHELLAEQLVKGNEQRSIEQLELVFPQDMEDLRIAPKGVRKETGVHAEAPNGLPKAGLARTQIPMQRQHANTASRQHRKVKILVAANDINTEIPLLRKALGERDGIPSVATTCQNGYVWHQFTDEVTAFIWTVLARRRSHCSNTTALKSTLWLSCWPVSCSRTSRVIVSWRKNP